MDGDGAVLAELLLGLVHLADEVDEALPRLWHALFRPVRELELPNSPGLAVLERRAQPCSRGQWWSRLCPVPAGRNPGLQPQQLTLRRLPLSPPNDAVSHGY